MARDDDAGRDCSLLPDSRPVVAATLVAYEGLAGNDVVKGQTLRLGVYLAECGVSIEALLFERLDRMRRGRDDLKALRAGAEGIAFRTRLVPRLPGPLGLTAAGVMARPFLRAGEGVVHCRGIRGVRVATCPRLSSLDRPILADIRGAEPEEAQDLLERGLNPERLRMCGSTSPLKAALDDVERAAIAASNAVCCVSNALADHLVAKYGLDRGGVEVVHCGADRLFTFNVERREATRRALGLLDSLVLCYVGGLTAVHRPDLLAGLVSALSRATDMPLVLLVLSRDRDGADSLCRSLAPSVRCICRSVETQELPDYLCASDVGLLTLDASFRNSVCFPIKFSEYSCCGLPVLATPYASDPASCIRSSGMGALVVQEAGGQWRVTWPWGESLSSCVKRITAMTSMQRAAHAERSAQTMRFDHTAERVAKRYETMMSEWQDMRSARSWPSRPTTRT